MIRIRRFLAAAALLIAAPCTLAEEDECRTSADCASDEECTISWESACSGSGPMVCASRLPEGAPCLAAELPCRSEHVCHGAFDPPVCRPPSQAGEPCASVWDCASRHAEIRLFCNPAEQRCRDERSLPPGAACPDDVPLACERGTCRGGACPDVVGEGRPAVGRGLRRARSVAGDEHRREQEGLPPARDHASSPVPRKE